MAFGQQSGPPASSQQVRELLSLLQGAGHADFRDARGPMGFTQRQAGGKFTRDEAAALIDHLQDEQEQEGGADEASSAAQVASLPPRRPLSSADQAIRRIPADALAAELRRRGWTTEPPPLGAS